jgi:hypothetical protein
MDETEAAEPSPADEADKNYLTVRQVIQLRRQNEAPSGGSVKLKAGPVVQAST